jgi:riboflavin synthase
MFSGIVEKIGNVVRVGPPKYYRPGLEAHPLAIDGAGLFNGLLPGASVAVNGVCLTLTGICGPVGTFDVVPQTWRNTALHTLRAGDPVNLERSARLGDRIEGHFVQGHVDGVGTVEQVETSGGDWTIWVRAPSQLSPYLIRKGSVALDGTSLTIVDTDGCRFSVALIPETLQRSVLGRRRPGDPVNIETDLLARLVARQLERLGSAAEPAPPPSVSFETLRAAGFI